MMPQGGNVPLRCYRFIYGYALDSEFPCYLLWPCRDQEEYWLVDTMTDGYFKRCITSMMHFLSMEEQT